MKTTKFRSTSTTQVQRQRENSGQETIISEMASGGTIQSVLGKISKDHLECSICCNRFKHPKLLDCLHSFCQKCLQELMRESNDPNSDKLPCPLCRQETTLKDKTVTDLPNNFSMTALVEAIDVQQQILEGQESEVICQSCDDNHKAIARCMDCDHFICEECHKVHARDVALKSHKICTNLHQLQSVEIAYKSKATEVPKCKKHSDQNLIVYCNTCEHMLCVMCIVLDEKCKHTLIELSEALKQCKEDVAEQVEQAEKSKTALNTLIDETQEYHRKLNSLFADTKMRISVKADKEVARIRRKEKKLIKELVEMHQDRVNKADVAQSTHREEVVKLEQKLDEVNHLLAQARCYEILDLKPKLNHSFRELTEKQPEKLPDRLLFIDFVEGQSSLGRLVLKDDRELKDGKWELKTELQNFESSESSNPNFRCAFDVSSYSNNEVVVADCVIKQFITCSLNLRTTAFRSQEQQILGIINPLGFSVNKDDQLIVVDDRAVKIFNRKYQLLYQFTPDKMSISGPSCIAVDDNNLIAVGYKHNETISLHNPDGSLIKTLPAPMLGGLMTFYKQNIIYTNYGKKKLLSVDLKGSIVFSVDITNVHQNGFPTGVCCDNDGSIYVAVLHAVGSIDRFSPNGKHIGCVITGCNPCGMTITPCGHLVVASYKSVQVYHRV